MMVAALTAAWLAQMPGQLKNTTGPVGESSRNFTLELKLGPYTPMIDSVMTLAPDAKGQRPYARVFGGTPMLMGELGLEYMILQQFGTLSAGLSVAYAEKFGKAIIAETGEKADQSTGLRLLTFRPGVTYRFDWAAFKYKVPLIPYAKVQFVTMPWWIENAKELEYADGLPGQGVSFGFAGTLGISFMLDVLDQRLARDFDSSVGVNHTYLFAEFNFQEMVPWREKAGNAPLLLSSRHWLFGVAFDL